MQKSTQYCSTTRTYIVKIRNTLTLIRLHKQLVQVKAYCVCRFQYLPLKTGCGGLSTKVEVDETYVFLKGYFQLCRFFENKSLTDDQSLGKKQAVCRLIQANNCVSLCRLINGGIQFRQSASTSTKEKECQWQMPSYRKLDHLSRRVELFQKLVSIMCSFMVWLDERKRQETLCSLFYGVSCWKVTTAAFGKYFLYSYF